KRKRKKEEKKEDEKKKKKKKRKKREKKKKEEEKKKKTKERKRKRKREKEKKEEKKEGKKRRGKETKGLAPGTAASAITMPLLQTVRNELPEVMVYLQESSGTALNDKLLAGQLDMAVLYERFPGERNVKQAQLEKKPLPVRHRAHPGAQVGITAGEGEELVPAPQLQAKAGRGEQGI
ncbi:hypothetical protein I8Q49_22165, partial [Acinetobacter baumannii]|nr:hypothetical protein [Acinetobacter baumannii]